MHPIKLPYGRRLVEWSGWQRWRRAGPVAVICVAATLILEPTGQMRRSELFAQDLRFHVRGARATRTKIVIVEIADSTNAHWPEPMLFWGRHFAGGIEQARRLGAAWIGLDYIHAASPDPFLPEPAPGEELPDRAFARAVSGGQVVLSYAGPTRPIPPLLYAHPGQPGDIGFTQSQPEVDNAVRRALVFTREGDELLPGFVGVLAARAKGIKVGPNADQLRALAGGTSPEVAEGAIWINYLGPPGTVPRLPLELLAENRLTARERELFRGAVVLIGSSFSGDNDKHKGPGGATFSGVEINAHSLATLLDGRPLRRYPPRMERLTAAGLCVLVAVAVACLSFGWGLAFTGAVTLGWTALCWQGFHADVLLPAAGPLTAIWLAWIGQVCVRLVEESARRRRVERIFGPHLGKSVMRRLLDDKGATDLGGQRREMTILFSDIRDFTPLTERLSAEEVVLRLNEYFGQMTQCVFHYDGTLDKYIGDSVMAFWNSPEGQNDHPERALAAAWEMTRCLEWLNRKWRSEGGPTLRVGIGINTGEVVVGNLGTDDRKMYTIIGSAVNFAARIESANKELGTTLLIGEATYRRVKGTGTFRERTVRMKGFDEPITVYEVLSFTNPASLPSPVARGELS